MRYPLGNIFINYGIYGSLFGSRFEEFGLKL